MTKTISPEFSRWRIQVFAVTWLAYFGMYFCRKNFSVVMPLLSREIHTTKEEFAVVITVYSIMYMIGQFLNGYLSDKYGPRIIVGIGILLSIIANLLMGWMGTFGSFLFLMGLNGFGQSSGWSGLIKNMTPWFRKKERGVIMSYWTTCYVIGGMAATGFATYWLSNQSFFSDLSWRRAFIFPAGFLLICSILYISFTRNSPPDVGLESFEKDNTSKKGKRKDREAQLEVLKNSATWIAAAMYFFVKFIRYAFLFWLPLYFSEALKYSDQQAGYTSIAYEAFGFFGILTAGYLSDYLFKSRRFPVSSLMLFALAIVLALQPLLSSFGTTTTIISIGLIGFFNYGPDSLMSASAAMDIGKNRGAAFAAGLINGVGSAGQLLSPLIVAYISGKFGWNTLFQFLVVLSLIAALLLILKWNYGKENHETEITTTITPNLSTTI